MKTLDQFINEHGNRARAAVAIGVAEATLWRWTKGKSKPRGLALRRLKDLGIKLVHAAINSDWVLRGDFGPDRSEPQRAYSKEYVSEDSRKTGAKASGKHGQNLPPRVLGQTFKINKIARVVQVRPRNVAFSKNEEEMLLGMFDMTPSERVADVDQLRIRLWGLRYGEPPASDFKRVARIFRRSDAKE